MGNSIPRNALSECSDHGAVYIEFVFTVIVSMRKRRNYTKT